MSGGSLDYGYQRVRDLAEAIERRADRAEHRAFAAHLHKVAEAAKALEWVWSGDRGPGDEIDLIKAVVDGSAVSAEHLSELARRANDLLEGVDRMLKDGTMDRVYSLFDAEIDAMIKAEADR